jgi:hypothetical protein
MNAFLLQLKEPIAYQLFDTRLFSVNSYFYYPFIY